MTWVGGLQRGATCADASMRACCRTAAASGDSFPARTSSIAAYCPHEPMLVASLPTLDSLGSPESDSESQPDDTIVCRLHMLPLLLWEAVPEAGALEGGTTAPPSLLAMQAATVPVDCLDASLRSSSSWLWLLQAAVKVVWHAWDAAGIGQRCPGCMAGCAVTAAMCHPPGRCCHCCCLLC